MRHQDGPILTPLIYPIHDHIIGVELQADNFKQSENVHEDVIKWKHLPRYCPCVWGIHRSPVNSPNKGQWRGALMLSLIWAWTNGWVNNRGAGDLRPYRPHHDVAVMLTICRKLQYPSYSLAKSIPVFLKSVKDHAYVAAIARSYVAVRRLCCHWVPSVRATEHCEVKQYISQIVKFPLSLI